MSEGLIIFLCILAYIVVGICTSMGFAWYDVAHSGPIDEDDEEKYFYICAGIFWPISIISITIYFIGSSTMKIFTHFVRLLNKRYYDEENKE